MADSILRLRVESNEYDSKIKRAQQGLLHMEEACRKAGKSMNDMDKDQKQFVQSLGSMQTVSTSVRGKIGELSGAFVELRSQYNRLTDEEKKGDFGRALSGSLEQLKTRVAEAKAELKDIQKELDGSGFLSGMGDKMSGALQVFAGNMLTKVAGTVANFGSEMADMVKQGIELAKQGEGIRIAFERLGRGDILDGLREATHGTVTDIELMKAAVKFNDFKLPLNELGTMLAFAQQKAKDTGQSVDYMVDSIVTGLGRKSLMILDNLGLSAAEIKDKMAETGDMTKAVGAIIREQMAKAGDYVETAADRATQANVEMQNKLEELGRTFAPIQEAGVGMFNRLKMSAIDALNGMRPFFDQFTQAGRIRQQAEGMGGNDKVNGQLNKLKVARAAGSDYYVQFLYNSTIKDYEKQISDLNFKIAAFGKGRDGIEKGHIQRLKEQKEAVVQLMNEYKAGAKQIVSPIKPVIDTSGAEQSITSLTTKPTAAKEQTELQKNQQLIANLTQEYQVLADRTKTASGQELVAADDRMTAIRDEIRVLQERNEELKRWADLAQGKTPQNIDVNHIAAPDPSKMGVKALPLFDFDASKSTGVSQKAVDGLVSQFQQAVQTADIDGALMQKFQTGLTDATTLSTLLKTAIEKGVNTEGMDFAGLKEQIGRGLDIPDEKFEELQNKINEKLQAMGLEPINIDFKTGNIKEAKKLKDDGDSVAMSWSNASKAVGSIGSALQSIEDPTAKVAGLVAQAVAQIAATFAASLKGTFTPWDWIAGAAAGTATMLTTISAIKSATKGGFADGGIVPGNSYSGDNLRISDYGINSGELVLNRAQTNSIAAQLTDGDGRGQGRTSSSVQISSENLRIVLHNGARARGMSVGEYLNI